LTKVKRSYSQKRFGLELSTAIAILAIGTAGGCHAPIHINNWESLSIVLQRTTCLGPCPAYTVVVHGSGLVEYVGSENVGSTGSRTANIQPESVRQLLQSFDKINFLSLDASYFEGCTDMPTTTITLSFDSTTKRVSNNFGGCHDEKQGTQVELAKLAEQIDTASESGHWVRCKENCSK
jgi:hypothetical protein